jgi:hypothetical protein
MSIITFNKIMNKYKTTIMKSNKSETHKIYKLSNKITRITSIRINNPFNNLNLTVSNNKISDKPNKALSNL